MIANDMTPMSFAQQRLWFLDKLYPGQGLYNIPFAMNIEGEVDAILLEKAFLRLLDRHEILRTSFDLRNDEPMQVIHKTIDFKIELLDFSDFESPVQLVEKHRHQAIVHCFDLSKAPLILAKLIKYTNKKHELLITIHHIIADGWSMAIFMRELAAFYNAFTRGVETLLPKLDIHYADYSLWQREWLTGTVLQKQLDYWKTHLFQAPNMLQLPTDKQRFDEPSYEGKCYHYCMQNGDIKALKQLGEKNQCTLFMTFLTVFYILLYRYTNQDDIVIGTPIANRNYPGVDNLIGFFVNTLALRIVITESSTFSSLLAQVKKVALHAYDNQDVPFEQVVEAMQIRRELNKNPVFQVMFDYDQQSNDLNLLLDNASITLIPQELPLSKFDLTFLVQNKNDNFTLIIEYMTELFHPETIEQMAKHFENLIKIVLLKPNVPIDELNLLTKEEYQQLIFDWNDTYLNYPLHKSISQLFEEKALANPNHSAVICEDKILSYAQLNREANRLAWTIREAGANSKTIIGIYCDRSIEFLIGILATFKAGAAYLPLDPSHPDSRILQVMDQCCAEFILTTNKYSAQIEHSFFSSLTTIKPKTILIDGPDFHTKTSNLPVIHKPNDAAYIIYTSGSTGAPKGAIVSMIGTVNHALAMIDVLELQPRDILAQTAPQNCDISVWQFITPLVCGATVCIFTDETVKDTNMLIKAIEQFSISIYQIVASQFRVVLEELEYMQQNKPSLTNLRWMIPCGEALPPSLCRQWFGLYPIKLLNAYGPAECSDDVTTYCIHKSPDEHILNMPIGRPLPNNKVYVLNKKLSPVPKGVIGELYISGLGVGNGYINDPIKTAEVFMNNPFVPGKLYKTGDLVKYLPDGNLVYIGRRDQQVKIRGHRVELGDIEAMISKHDTVQQAAVLLEIDSNQQSCLIAFILPCNTGLSRYSKTTYIKNIRDSLAGLLPHYMIPNSFIVMDSLPLSENGKLDRKLLKDFIKEQTSSNENFMAPRDPIETEIADIWKKILHKEQIGVEDNFFILGGHSLSATQIMLRVCRHFEIDLALKVFFSAPTIAELADQVKATLNQAVFQSPACIMAQDRGDSIPLSFAQERLWFLSQLLPTKALYTSPLIFRLKGGLDINVLEKSFVALIARHEILRTIIQLDQDHRPIQKILNNIDFKIMKTEINLLDRDPSFYVEDLIKKEIYKGINLEQEPAIKATVFILNQCDFILLIAMHHIISDGWSMAILTKELSEIYNSNLEQRLPVLADLKIQYADFSIWQKSNLLGKKNEDALIYWTDHLRDAPQYLHLSREKIRPQTLTYHGQIYQFHLPKELLSNLKTLSIDHNTTLFMTLMGLFYTLLYRYSGQNDIVIGVPIANRNIQDIENLIGFFINVLPMRICAKANENFVSLLHKINDLALNGFEHQDLPFEQLVEAMQLDRSVNMHPIFQVAFVLQNTEDSCLLLKGIEAEPISVNLNTSRFDLTLFAEEINEQLILNVEYSTELFDADIIKDMAQHYVSLAHSIVAQPTESISKINYLTPYDQTRLNNWNATSRVYSTEGLIHELFEQQVMRTPEAIALIYKDDAISFIELNKKSNQLARYLKNICPAPTLVAVSLDRSFNMIISLFAILKVGSAYLPLDPTYPKDRLDLMLDIAQPDIVIAQNSSIDKLSITVSDVINLDQDWDYISKEIETNVSKVDLLETNLAYVIFTSGSTGVPKGVMMHHQGTLNRLNWMWEVYPFHEQEVCCQKTSLNFADSVWEIFGPLLKGVKIVLIPDETIKDHNDLILTLSHHKVSRIVMVPSLLRSLLTNYSKELADLSCLNFWVVSGEALTHDLTQKFYDIFSQATLLNLYGSSEVAADVTFFELNQPDTDNKTSISIGKPISNIKTYILDNNQQQLPVGAVGELYISGVGLAQGYLNQPELTAERFILNFFDEDIIYNRLFKTGDLARYLSDGNIEYLGRTDYQVKIRGHRIELGEIESCLQTIKGIEQVVVVVAQDNKEHDQRIIAYIVRSRSLECIGIDDNEFGARLHRDLSHKLPLYMMPNAFFILDKFPLTPSGKIDKLQLPNSSGNELHWGAYVAPRNELEYQLCAVWEKILQKKCVGVHDNFFEMGGHSLLVIRLTVEINKSVKSTISVIDIFTHPTVAEIAKLIHVDNTQVIPNLFLPISKMENNIPLFLIHPAGGLSFKFLLLSKYLESHAVYAINNPYFGKLNNNFTSIQDMASFYLAEIMKVHSGPFRLGGYSFGGLVAYEIAYQLEKIGKHVEMILLIDTYHPSLFDKDEDVLLAQKNIKKHLISEGLIPNTTEYNELMSEMLNSDKLSSNYSHNPCKADLHLLKASILNPLVKKDDYHGWSDFHKNTIHLHSITGEHHELFSPSCIEEVATTMNSILSAV